MANVFAMLAIIAALFASLCGGMAMQGVLLIMVGLIIVSLISHVIIIITGRGTRRA